MKDEDALAAIMALVQRATAKHLPPSVAAIYKRAVVQLAFFLFDKDEWTRVLEEPTECPDHIADLVLAWTLLQRVGAVEFVKRRKRDSHTPKTSKSDKSG